MFSLQEAKRKASEQGRAGGIEREKREWLFCPPYFPQPEATISSMNDD